MQRYNFFLNYANLFAFLYPFFFCPLKIEHTYLCENVIHVNCTHIIKEERFFAPLLHYNPFLLASYVSTVFVWMTTLVSPFCHASLLVVIVLVTLHELSPNAIATHVTMAVAIVAAIL